MCANNAAFTDWIADRRRTNPGQQQQPDQGAGRGFNPHGYGQPDSDMHRERQLASGAPLGPTGRAQFASDDKAVDRFIKRQRFLNRG